MNPLVEKIIANARPLVVSVTGGGAEVIGELTRYGGSSAFLLSAVAPWNQAALSKFLKAGYSPDKFCSPETARAMAMAGFMHGQEFSGKNPQVISVAATCKLAYEGEREGRAHEIYIATQTENCTSQFGFSINNKPRVEQSNFVSQLMLYAIANPHLLPENGRSIGNITSTVTTAPDELVDVVTGRSPGGVLRPFVRYKVGLGESTTRQTATMFCGSFNPIHKNHIVMCEIARQLLGSPVDLEISITNTDKPSLDYTSIDQRVKLIQTQCAALDSVRNLYLSCAPTFQGKARLFPGTTFVMGADTFNRLCDPAYLGSEEKLLASFEEYKNNGTRFLIFQRQGVQLSDKYETIIRLCQVVPDSLYVDDGHSSTKERRK